MLHRLDEGLPAQLAVDEDADKERIGDDHRAGFRRREEAVTKSEQQEDRKDQRPEAIDEAAPEFACGRALFQFGRIAVITRDEEGRRHQPGRHQETGNDAAEQQPPDRDFRDEAEQHEPDARRNGRGDHRAEGDDAGAEPLGVTALLHRAAKQARFHRGIGDGRAGNAAHERTEDDGDLRQPARQPAGQKPRKFEQPLRDAGRIHQIAGEDEERHGQQRKRLRGVVHALHGDGRRHVIADQEDRDGRERECERYGYVDEQKEEEEQDGDQRQHHTTSRTSVLASRPESATKICSTKVIIISAKPAGSAAVAKDDGTPMSGSGRRLLICTNFQA